MQKLWHTASSNISSRCIPLHRLMTCTLVDLLVGCRRQYKGMHMSCKQGLLWWRGRTVERQSIVRHSSQCQRMRRIMPCSLILRMFCSKSIRLLRVAQSPPRNQANLSIKKQAQLIHYQSRSRVATSRSQLRQKSNQLSRHLASFQPRPSRGAKNSQLKTLQQSSGKQLSNIDHR